MGHNNLLSPDAAFGRLAEFSCQDDTTESLLNYQGRLVQTLNSPCYAFFSQSNADQNNAHPVNPLNEFSVASLTQASSDSFDESDLTVVSGSVCDEYVTCNPNKESLEELFPILGDSLCGQSYLSENEPDLSEQTPSNRLNLNQHLTDLPAELAYPQDSRSATVVNPLNLQQANSDNPVNSTIIVADKSSQAERKREGQRKRYQNNPTFAERKKEHQRKRYQNNPAFAERKKEHQRKRYQTDSAFAERKREYQKQRRRNDPAFAERKREYKRQRRRNDPAFAARQRERYRNGLAFAERQKVRRRCQRECLVKRCQNDPVYAKGRKIYNNTYNKMKRKMSKEEASKLASVAREKYFRSVNSSEDSGNLPQTSNPA